MSEIPCEYVVSTTLNFCNAHVFREADSFLGTYGGSAGQEVPSLLGKPKIRYRVHRSPLLDRTVREISPVHSFKNSSTGTECSLLVFGRFLVQIPAGTPAILTEVFCGFPQSLQASVEIVPRLDRFLPSNFQFVSHLLPYQ